MLLIPFKVRMQNTTHLYIDHPFVKSVTRPSERASKVARPSIGAVGQDQNKMHGCTLFSLQAPVRTLWFQSNLDAYFIQVARTRSFKIFTRNRLYLHDTWSHMPIIFLQYCDLMMCIVWYSTFCFPFLGIFVRNMINARDLNH